MKKVRSKLSDSKSKLRTEKEGRTYQEKKMKIALNEIFKTYGITPQQYHGGTFVGNRVRIFMADVKEIYDDIATLFKSCEEIIVFNN